ncbi:MAG: response regulator [Polyangiaceae bacterium]|nr:response regulator [Polyangiaceae bacterium]
MPTQAPQPNRATPSSSAQLRSKASQAQRSGRVRLVGLLFAVSVLFHSGVVLLRGRSTAVHWWTDIGWTLISLIAAAKCVDTALRQQRRHQRRAWWCFAIGCASWFLGMLIWDYFELVATQITPFPAVSDVFFFALVPAFIAGFWFQKQSAPSVPLTLKHVGDLGVTLSVAAMVGAMMLYRPATQLTESRTYVASALAYPVLHLSMLLFGLSTLWQYNWGRRRRVLSVQVLATALLAAVTTLYGHSLLIRSYEAGHVIDVFWVGAFCLMIWAAYEADWLHTERSRVSDVSPTLDALVPALGVLAITVVAFAFHTQWTTELVPFLVGLGVMLALFMGMRAWGSSQLVKGLLDDVRREERRFRVLLDDAPIGIAYIRDDGKVAICNRRLKQMTKSGSIDLLEGEEWVESGVSDRIRTVLLRKERIQSEHTLAAPEKGQEGEKEHLSSELERHIQLSVAPLGGGGALALISDGTEQHMLLKQLVQAQKMEAVGSLAGGLAHDFNNLLTAMLAGVSLVRLKQDDPELDEHLEQMEQSMWQAAELTQRLLTLSRKREATMGPMQPAKIVRRVAKLLERSIAETITLKLDLEEEDLCILGDGGQLEQALLNLALNARDAMPEGGRLEFKMRVADLTAASARSLPGSYLVLTVTDTGHGIPEEVQSRVFEPFFTTKAAGEGTGLGLAMVYASMKEQGGWASVSSLMGRGTTFSLYLPAREADASEVESDRFTSALPQGTESILVVDDRDAPLLAAKGVLDACGYRVVLAWSGAEALERISKGDQAFDLVITDAVMPNMGGRRLLAELKAREVNIPVILATGYEVDPHTSSDSFSAVIAKPYHSKELARIVRRVLDERANQVSSSSRAG